MVQPDIPVGPKPISTSPTLGIVGICLQLGLGVFVLVALVAPQAFDDVEDAGLLIFGFFPFSLTGLVLSGVAIIDRRGGGRIVGIVGTVLGVIIFIGLIALFAVAVPT